MQQRGLLLRFCKVAAAINPPVSLDETEIYAKAGYNRGIKEAELSTEQLLSYAAASVFVHE